MNYAILRNTSNLKPRIEKEALVCFDITCSLHDPIAIIAYHDHTVNKSKFKCHL